MSNSQQTRAEWIADRLQSTLNPTALEVIDESPLHAGHAGAPQSGESHFRIRMSAQCLEGLSRIAQHRLIYETLQMDTGILHALVIEIV